MKRILIVSSYPYKKCGVSRYTGYLVKGLNRKKLKIYYQKIQFRDDFKNYLRNSVILVNKILTKKADILHVQYTPTIIGPFGPLFIFLARLKKIKIFLTIHESSESYRDKLPAVFHKLLELYELIMFSFTDRIIVMSEVLNKKYLNNKMLMNKIILIRQGINKSTEIKSVSNKELSKIANKNLIGYFGFIRKGKGIDEILTAYKDIANAIPETALIIAGETKDRDYFKNLKLFEIKNQLKNVYWMPFLADREMKYLISRSKLVVLPYKKVNNSGILMEAISANTPVITSDAEYFREYVNTFKIGITYDRENTGELAKKTIDLLQKPSQLMIFKNNEARLAEEMSWNNISESHNNLYETY